MLRLGTARPESEWLNRTVAPCTQRMRAVDLLGVARAVDPPAIGGSSGVRSGRPAETIRKLADLVTPALRDALLFFLARSGGRPLQDLKPAPEDRYRSQRARWSVVSEWISACQVVAESCKIGLECDGQALYPDQVALVEARHRQLWQCALHCRHGVPEPTASLHEGSGIPDEAFPLQVLQEARDDCVVKVVGFHANGRAPAHEAAERAPLVLGQHIPNGAPGRTERRQGASSCDDAKAAQGVQRVAADIGEPLCRQTGAGRCEPCDDGAAPRT